MARLIYYDYLFCCLGMSTELKWCIKPPEIAVKTLSESLPQTLRLVNAGAITDSSDWTCWPRKVI